MFKVQFAACAFFYLDLFFPSTVLGTRGGLDCRSLQVSISLLLCSSVYPTHDAAHLETLAVPLITHPLRLLLLRSCHCLTVHILSVVRVSDTAPSQRGAASCCYYLLLLTKYVYINKQTYKATAPKQSLDDQIKRLHCLADPLLTRVAVQRSAANWAGAAIGCRLLLLHHSTTRRQQATCPTGPATGSESEEKDGEASNASHHVANPYY